MRIRGFTPVFDSIVKRFGATVALVYGKIWRYCDWSDMGICTASNGRLAEELDLSESTIKRTKALLESEGFIRIAGKSGGVDTISVIHDAVMSLDIEEPGQEPKSFIPRSPATANYAKRGDIIDAVIEHAMEYATDKDMDWMLPDTQEKIMMIPPRFWKGLSKSEQRRWNAHVSAEWKHHTKEEVARAWALHVKQGLMFSGPWSLDYAFKNLEELETDLDKRRADLYGD